MDNKKVRGIGYIILSAFFFALMIGYAIIVSMAIVMFFLSEEKAPGRIKVLTPRAG